MTVTTWAAVAVAGSLGALARNEWVGRGWHERRMAELNVLGAFLLGAASVALDGRALVVLGAGLLGATTSFSTWMVQADELDRPRDAAVLVVGPLVLGVAAAAAGRLLLRALGSGG